MKYEHDFTIPSSPHELGNAYWFDGMRLSRAFCQRLPARVADLLEVALAVYAADRRSRRNFRGINTGQRHIHAKVSVSDPGLWNEPTMQSKLQEFLYWLSEDDWSLQFVQRRTLSGLTESGQFLFELPPEPPVTVSLFSGGLDSLAGFAACSREHQDGSFVLVSGYTNERLASLQRTQVQEIRKTLRARDSLATKPTICHIAIPFGLHKIKGQREEKGQRTRGLVFLALGAAAALQAEVNTLWVYENGVGALNLPINETQLGVDNYRGVHPRSLMMAETLFALALDQAFRIRNPFAFHTKAEMCRALKPAGLAHVVPHTVSCDSFPLRLHDRPSQCGYCTSCVLRRQSLLAAGLEDFDPGERYACDLIARRDNVETKRLFGLGEMQGQVYKLSRCLDSLDPWRSLTLMFPELYRAHAEVKRHHNLEADDARAQIVRLFRTYVRDWDLLPRPL